MCLGADSFQVLLSIVHSGVLTALYPWQFMVRSFTGSYVEHSVAVDFERYLILSCTCADQTKHKMPCKHMYLVSRIYRFLDVGYRAGPMLTNPERTQSDNDESFNSSLESAISPQLLQQLQVARAEDREEKKRKREEASAQAFRRCENELMEQWVVSCTIAGRDDVN